MDNELILLLKQASLFRDLPQEVLVTLSETVHLRHLKQNDILFLKDDPGNSLFVVSKGRLKVFREDTGGVEIILNQIEPGNMVGEVALFDQEPRSASVNAMEDSDVLELKREDFLNLISQNGNVALAMMRNMSNRMRANALFIQKITEFSQKFGAGDREYIKEIREKTVPKGESVEERAQSSFLSVAKELTKRPPRFIQMQAIEPDLRNLLPAELYADLYVAEWADQKPDGKLEDDKSDRERIKKVFDHLSALQKILSDYVSSLIIEKRNENVKQQIIYRNGALMFTDLAGFTKLMESNAKEGKQGAESLLGVLTKYFTEIIEVISKSGGELLEFTGDALLVLFPAQFKKGEEVFNKSELQKAISKAVRAGLRMQKIMVKDYQEILTASGEKIKLQMRIGIHAGLFYSADIGTPRRREHVLLGRNVQIAKRAEGFGENGSVNLTPDAYDYVKNDFQFKTNPNHDDHQLVIDTLEEKEGYEIMAKSPTRRLASTMLLDKSFDNTYEQIKNLLTAIKEFSSFIPHQILGLLIESAARRKIIPEFPEPTIMFVNFIGLPEMIDKRNEKGEPIFEKDSIVASFNETFARLNAAVEKRGGMLKKVTYHLTGSDIVIYFGVPNPHSNDPMRAASAAVEIRDIIKNTKIPARRPGCEDPEQDKQDRIYCQIGINTGPTFVAEIGDPRGRREFNVLGDTVNTTARLMSKAEPNKILISEAVQSQIDEKYECVKKDPMQLKGKSKEVVVYELVEKKK